MMFGHVLAGERDKSLKRIQKGRVKFKKKTEKYVSTWSFMSSILVCLVTPYMDREERVKTVSMNWNSFVAEKPPLPVAL